MIMISDDTLLFAISVAVDICADNFVDVEVDLEFGLMFKMSILAKCNVRTTSVSVASRVGMA